MPARKCAPLGLGVQGEAFGLVVEAQQGPGLHRRDHDPVVDDGHRHRPRGRRKGRVDGGAIARLPVEGALGRTGRIGFGGAFVEIDRHSRRRLFRRSRAFGHDHGDAVAHMAHGFAAQQRLNRCGEGGAVAAFDRCQTGHRPVSRRRHVSTGQHQPDAGARAGRIAVQPRDRRRRQRAAHEDRMQAPFHGQIGHEPAAAGQMTPVFQPRQGGTDQGLVRSGHGTPLGRRCAGDGVACPLFSGAS